MLVNKFLHPKTYNFKLWGSRSPGCPKGKIKMEAYLKEKGHVDHNIKGSLT
jgi:hypothetical protein